MAVSAVKLVFASCSDDLIESLILHVDAIGEKTPVVVVSEFQPASTVEWIPYRLSWTTRQNEQLIASKLRGRTVVAVATILQPNMPFWPMRWMAFKRMPWGLLVFNENLGHFGLRPSNVPTMIRHVLWRTGNWFRWNFRPAGPIYTWAWRILHPIQGFRRPLLYRQALWAGLGRSFPAIALPAPSTELPPGITVVIPSRNGKALLELCLPPLLAQNPNEILVVDNGSDDGTAEWLHQTYPGQVRVIEFTEPLSFSNAVNQGIRAARFSRVCLLNNDMVIEPAFLSELQRAFDEVPDLFSATAQIFFPEGVRREETGKAMMAPREHFSDFTVTCLTPFAGEDHTYVLYGSGGCSLYDTVKLRQLGALDEIYTPAYVEDLDLGVRAWRQAWPSVFVAGARVLHQHRATTKRYLSEEQLQHALEVNYLKFLMRAFSDRGVFNTLWTEAVYRINCYSAESQPHLKILAEAKNARRWIRPLPPARMPESEILALNNGRCAIFPGRGRTGKPVILVAACYLPYPLSHGGAVRMYNLMRRAAETVDQVLIAFSTALDSVPPELLAICCEVVVVQAWGSHDRPLTDRPDAVEEFDRPEFHAALKQTIRKWKPQIVQLEFTQLAVYANDCKPAQQPSSNVPALWWPAPLRSRFGSGSFPNRDRMGGGHDCSISGRGASPRTILVEHDITLDLYGQLLNYSRDWETEREHQKWQTFERAAWKQVDCVITMSDKDSKIVEGARRVEPLINGVDLARFQPSAEVSDPARLLFIGSFAHLPNVLALDWFLKKVWPHLSILNPTLHIIAGSRPEYYLERYADKARPDLKQSGIELEAFVSDVRPAYRKASIVIAPLLASAGTNIKIMEAMAMGKAIVSSPGGINGLDLEHGKELIVAKDPDAMADAIMDLIRNPHHRLAFERRAREGAERNYNWDVIAERQNEIYVSLMDGTNASTTKP